MIAEEDKAHPLSDDRLSEMLKKEGFPVARRTVAKYRGLLGIPGTSERRH
jgi:RNA polymerase sigma-54 factor